MADTLPKARPRGRQLPSLEHLEDTKVQNEAKTKKKSRKPKRNEDLTSETVDMEPSTEASRKKRRKAGFSQMLN